MELTAKEKCAIYWGWRNIDFEWAYYQVKGEMK